MSKSIRVSEKHGVNPTTPICFWCGKEKNEVALLGKLPGDEKAPINAIIDYEPCDECAENMNKGIVIMEASEKRPEDERPLYHGAYPTGRWAVVNDNFVSILPDDERREAVLKGKRMYVDREFFDKIILPHTVPYTERAKEE